MKVNDYTVRILQGSEDNNGYVFLEHNIKYALMLGNIHPTSCNAQLEIDGINQGTWRIDRYSSIKLERPAHDNGYFTFYKLESKQGSAVLDANNDNLGLVKVTFTPEKVKPVVCTYDPSASKSYDSYNPTREGAIRGGDKLLSYSAGGTGLSGKSQQEYGSAKEIELDYLQQTVIYLRLIAVKNNEDEPRPLTPFSNSIPPRIA